MKNEASTTLDLGNNESWKTGTFPQSDGTFTAMTFSASKTFKTRAGAERWLAARGYTPNGVGGEEGRRLLALAAKGGAS